MKQLLLAPLSYIISPQPYILHFFNSCHGMIYHHNQALVIQGTHTEQVFYSPFFFLILYHFSFEEYSHTASTYFLSSQQPLIRDNSKFSRLAKKYST